MGRVGEIPEIFWRTCFTPFVRTRFSALKTPRQEDQWVMITTMANVVNKELCLWLSLSVCGHFIEVHRVSMIICSFCVLSRWKFSKVNIDASCITWMTINSPSQGFGIQGRFGTYYHVYAKQNYFSCCGVISKEWKNLIGAECVWIRWKVREHSRTFCKWKFYSSLNQERAWENWDSFSKILSCFQNYTVVILNS